MIAAVNSGRSHATVGGSIRDMEKKCSRCQTFKSRTFYNRNRSQKDGLDGLCRPCRSEYQKERGRMAVSKARWLNESGATKRCGGICGEVKGTAEFYRHLRSADGLRAACKACERPSLNRKAVAWRKASPAKARAIINGWRKRQPRARRVRDYRTQHLKKYGLTLSEYGALLAEQNAQCAICSKPETQIRHGRPRLLSVDHCHSTGRVRGLLCSKCNIGIGHAGDDIAILEAMIRYLKRHAVEELRHGAA